MNSTSIGLQAIAGVERKTKFKKEKVEKGENIKWMRKIVTLQREVGKYKGNRRLMRDRDRDREKERTNCKNKNQEQEEEDEEEILDEAFTFSAVRNADYIKRQSVCPYGFIFWLGKEDKKSIRITEAHTGSQSQVKHRWLPSPWPRQSN